MVSPYYPDDGELQEVLIRVADERLYKLKNGTRAPAPAASAPLPETNVPAVPEFKSRFEPPVNLGVNTPAAPAPPVETKKTGEQQRRWERVSLQNTHAYAMIGEGVERTARVLDLGYGGVALETSRPQDLADTFQAVLHVPILPPVRVSLHRVYQNQTSSGAMRIGCSFVT